MIPLMNLTLRQPFAAWSVLRARGLTAADGWALIVATAIEAGCDTLLSEDLQDGRRIAGLRIVNPFA